jgi:hypothetical protein
MIFPGISVELDSCGDVPLAQRTNLQILPAVRTCLHSEASLVIIHT